MFKYILDANRESDECSNGIKRIAPSFIFDVALPSLDVYSDLSLIIPWYWNGHYKYAASMTAPLLLQFSSTAYKWFQLENPKSKKWSWIVLLLQCWPQWRAIRMMHLDFRNDKQAEAKKKELMREVTTTEPFLEAWPSIIVMTIIWILAVKDRIFEKICYDNDDFRGSMVVWENNNLTWTCEYPLDPPPQYCEINPQNNKCAVFSGPGGSTWFIVTYFLSLISGSLGITKFLQSGPYAVLTTDGLLGGILRRKFIIVFLSVLTSLVTKCFFIGFLVETKISEETNSTSVRKDMLVQEVSWLQEVPLIMILLIILVTLILPNLVLSVISISCSTGLNKKLLKVIINYPASWMLPIATYFTIGPYKSNLCCQTDINRNLGLSTFYSAINTLLNLIMYVALSSIFGIWEVLVIFVGPLFVIGLVFNIIYLIIDKQCCCSNCCCQESVVPVHLINVNRDDLQFVTIQND